MMDSRRTSIVSPPRLGSGDTPPHQDSACINQEIGSIVLSCPALLSTTIRQLHDSSKWRERQECCDAHGLLAAYPFANPAELMDSSALFGL